MRPDRSRQHLLLTGVSRQALLQLFSELLPAPGGRLHRLLGGLRSKIVGFGADLFGQEPPRAGLRHGRRYICRSKIIAHSPAQRIIPASRRDTFFRRLAKAALKGFGMLIFLKLNRDDDKIPVLSVSEPSRLEHVLVEPNPHFDHLMGEIRSAQCDRDRGHGHSSRLCGAKTSLTSAPCPPIVISLTHPVGNLDYRSVRVCSYP